MISEKILIGAVFHSGGEGIKISKGGPLQKWAQQNPLLKAFLGRFFSPKEWSREIAELLLVPSIEHFHHIFCIKNYMKVENFSCQPCTLALLQEFVVENSNSESMCIATQCHRFQSRLSLDSLPCHFHHHQSWHLINVVYLMPNPGNLANPGWRPALLDQLYLFLPLLVMIGGFGRFGRVRARRMAANAIMIISSVDSVDLLMIISETPSQGT